MLRAATALLLLLLPLAGCMGTAPFHRCVDDDWPEWSEGTHVVIVCNADHEARAAFLFVPGAFAHSKSLPLLLMLHGGGGNADQFRHSSAMDEAADDLGFAVLYAEGTPARGTKELRTWNAMACCGRAFDRQTDDVAFLGALLEGALERYPVDASRIGVAGHSNGAMMAYRLAGARSDVVTAAMPVAGSIGGQVAADAPIVTIPEPAQPVSILAIHARDDDHVPYGGGHGNATVDGPRIDLSVEDALQFWLHADGCQRVGPGVSSEERADGTHLSSYATCERGTVVQALLTDGGHGWPGSSSGFNPAPAVPDASREIGEFLLAHPRGAAAG